MSMVNWRHGPRPWHCRIGLVLMRKSLGTIAAPDGSAATRWCSLELVQSGVSLALAVAQKYGCKVRVEFNIQDTRDMSEYPVQIFVNPCHSREQLISMVDHYIHSGTGWSPITGLDERRRA